MLDTLEIAALDETSGQIGELAGDDCYFAGQRRGQIGFDAGGVSDPERAVPLVHRHRRVDAVVREGFEPHAAASQESVLIDAGTIGLGDDLEDVEAIGVEIIDAGERDGIRGGPDARP